MYIIKYWKIIKRELITRLHKKTIYLLSRHCVARVIIRYTEFPSADSQDLIDNLMSIYDNNSMAIPRNLQKIERIKILVEVKSH